MNSATLVQTLVLSQTFIMRSNVICPAPQCARSYPLGQGLEAPDKTVPEASSILDNLHVNPGAHIVLLRQLLAQEDDLHHGGEVDTHGAHILHLEVCQDIWFVRFFDNSQVTAGIIEESQYFYAGHCPATMNRKPPIIFQIQLCQYISSQSLCQYDDHDHHHWWCPPLHLVSRHHHQEHHQ